MKKELDFITAGISILKSGNIVENIIDVKDITLLSRKLGWHKKELDVLRKEIKKLEIELEYEKDENKINIINGKIEDLEKRKKYSEYRVPEIKGQIQKIKNHK